MLDNLITNDQIEKAKGAIHKHEYAKWAFGAATFIPLLGAQLFSQLALKVLFRPAIDLSYMLITTRNFFDIFLKTKFIYLAGRACQPIGSTLIFHEFFQSYLLEKKLFPVIEKVSPKVVQSTNGKIARILLTTCFFTASNYTLYYRHELEQGIMIARSVNDFVLGLFCSTLREMTGNVSASMALSIVKNELAPLF